MISTKFRSCVLCCGLLIASNSSFATPLIWESNFGNELTDLTGQDDETTAVTLNFDFLFAGSSFDTVYIGTNGGIQLGDLGDDGDISFDFWEGFDGFNDDGAPVISVFNTDLDLSAEGAIHFNDFGNRAVFTWNEVGTHQEEQHLLTFQVQLFNTGSIVFGYNGILDGNGEDLEDSLDEGISIGISKSEGNDDGSSDLSSGLFSSVGNTVYELWCYDDVDSCDGGRAGALNSAFDLDQKNIIFTPNSNGGFDVSNTASVPEPASLFLLGLGFVGLSLRRSSKQ